MIVSLVSAGTQKLSEHDRDRGQSQLCEAGQVSENLRSVVLSGQGEKTFQLDGLEKFTFALRLSCSWGIIRFVVCRVWVCIVDMQQHGSIRNPNVLALLVYYSKGILTVCSCSPAGENEGQKQTGASSAGHHQGVCDESGREDQGGDPGVEPDQHQTLGCLTQELHSGELIMERQNMSLTLSCCPEGG